MLIRGDARFLPLADGCVDCVVTSPPYWGLRDYGNAEQLGMESTPDGFVDGLVSVFAELRRVLKPQGTCWLNLGDSYCGYWGDAKALAEGRRSSADTNGWTNGYHMNARPKYETLRSTGIKPKDLVGIPWRVAFALQADGWYLRSDIIWSKPNPMPESVTDRPTKAHEYLFLLTKSERYFYDADAIKEPYALESESRYRYAFGGDKVDARIDEQGLRTTPRGMREYKGQATKDYDAAGAQNPSDTKRRILDSMEDGQGRNKRTVWTINTMPYAGAHFATMPEKLVEPCILAGCPLGGLVLDPFVGSGTVVAVAERLGRRGVGVDLSYQDLSRERTAQRGLRFDEGDADHVASAS